MPVIHCISDKMEKKERKKVRIQSFDCWRCYKDRNIILISLTIIFKTRKANIVMKSYFTSRGIFSVIVDSYIVKA